MNDPTPLLEVDQLTKHFPVMRGVFRRQVASVHAVDAVSFGLFKGETLGLVGESGCGKSTVARCAVGLTSPTSGRILYKGIPFDQMSSDQLIEARREIQIVFQDPSTSLNPRMSILEALTEPMRVYGLYQTEKEIVLAVEKMLNRVGLDGRILHKFPHQFSGGQLQRICIARALTLQPKVLVCDEAVSSLDVSVQGQILNLLNQLQEELGIACLFISHDLAVIRQISHRVVVMYLGNVMESAPAEELFASPQHPYTQALIDSVPRRHPDEQRRGAPLAGEMPSALTPPSGCRFRTRCPFAELSCAQAPPERSVGKHAYRCILSWCEERRAAKALVEKSHL